MFDMVAMLATAEGQLKMPRLDAYGSISRSSVEERLAGVQREIQALSVSAGRAAATDAQVAELRSTVDMLHGLLQKAGQPAAATSTTTPEAGLPPAGEASKRR